MTTENNDDFDAAFAEVVATLSDAPAVVEPVVADIAPVVEPAAVEPAAVEPAAVVEPAVVEPAVVEPAAAPVAAPAIEPAAPVETAEAKAARETFETSISPYTPTEEEVQALEQFKKEFPGEAMAVEARLKSIDRDINARVYQAVQNYARQVEARLVPVERTVTTSAIEAHVNMLHTAHADYDTVITKVPDWIKTLPSYAQAGAQAVFDQGTAQEVIALVNDYKKASGVVSAPAPVTAPAPAAKPAPTGADDLAPVSQRRVAVTPTGTPDPNDFDAGFADAVRDMK